MPVYDDVLDRDNLIEEILDDLGRVVDDDGKEVIGLPEISRRDVGRYIDRVLRLLSRWHPVEENVTLVVSPSARYVDLEFPFLGLKLVVPNVNMGSEGGGGDRDGFLFTSSPWITGGSGYGGGGNFSGGSGGSEERRGVSLEDVAVADMHFGLRKRTLSVDFNWRLVGSRLYIEDLPAGANGVNIEYVRALDNLNEVAYNWHDWFQEYVLALSRLRVGEVRSKFQEIPGAGGGISLNGEDLISRAREDIERLDGQLKSRAVMYPPLIDK